MYQDNHWRTSLSSKVLTVHGLINVGHEVTTYEGKPFRPICTYGMVWYSIMIGLNYSQNLPNTFRWGM